MSEFKLEIITPKQVFLEANVEAVTVSLSDGELTVLKNHLPMVAALSGGNMGIKQHGEVKNAYCSEGFMEVRPDEVLVFTKMCVWADKNDAEQLKKAEEQKLERIRFEQSVTEHITASIDLARAAEKLRKSRR